MNTKMTEPSLRSSRRRNDNILNVIEPHVARAPDVDVHRRGFAAPDPSARCPATNRDRVSVINRCRQKWRLVVKPSDITHWQHDPAILQLITNGGSASHCVGAIRVAFDDICDDGLPVTFVLSVVDVPRSKAR